MSSHRHGRDSDLRRSDNPRPSGPRPIEPKPTDPRSNESRSDDTRLNGPRPMERRPTAPRNVDPQTPELQPSGQRTMGPRPSDPRPMGDQPQPGVSGIGGQRQVEITKLSEGLARIRLQIETTYPIKAEQEEKVHSPKNRIAQMNRDKRSEKSLDEADEELKKREDILKRTKKELEMARDKEEKVFMTRWEGEETQKGKDEVKRQKAKRRSKRRDIEEAKETVRRREHDVKEIKAALKQTKREKKSLTKKRDRLSLRV
ncbi:copper radical oxidase [Fusarium pseudocircinatum]|uniref:Copper radical oxidase n=1 Tax=Fusarium pseudocircinatum TaxID=56676 RepID=A0A8H5L186_9HYPO|nr:copper radical oxidase [Fusarium pseudocircinatum]